jgi:hypothetical protein
MDTQKDRTPVEWISIGIGTIALGLILLTGGVMIGIGLYGELVMGITMWFMIPTGLIVLAIPVVLYKFGQIVTLGWAWVDRQRH